MGSKNCCRKEQTPLEIANDQIAFTEALSKEKLSLQEYYQEKQSQGKNDLVYQRKMSNKKDLLSENFISENEDDLNIS